MLQQAQGTTLDSHKAGLTNDLMYSFWVIHLHAQIPKRDSVRQRVLNANKLFFFFFQIDWLKKKSFLLLFDTEDQSAHGQYVSISNIADKSVMEH